MMKFALITEGASEHRIIKYIVAKFFKDSEPEFAQIQPKIINDRQETIGGWNEVLKFCSRKELEDIFVENDHLVIQIDSDKCPIKPFDIPHTKICELTGNNRNKTTEELHNDISEKLLGLISPEILKKYKDRIHLAISIHTIECWLLPILYTNNHRSDSNTCLQTLNAELRKKNINIIPVSDKNGTRSIRTYDLILRNWKNRESIEKAAVYHFGFNQFITSLQKVT